MPEDAVLWFQHPVVLVGEEEELGVESAHSGCGEGAFGLGVFNSEVTLSVDAEDGCVPFIDVEVRRSGEHLLHLSFRVFLPRRAAHVPVREPEFFGFDVLLLRVVDAVVGDERLESFVVVSGEPIDAVASETCADGAEAGAVNVGFSGEVVDGGKIVLHALTGVVAADFFKPFHAEAGETAAVRGDDDIVVRRHDLEVPAVTPELTDGRLRSSFAEEEGGIFLGGVKVRRIDNPAEFLLAVGGFDPALLDFSPGEVVVEVVVFVGDLFGFSGLFCFRGEREDFVGSAHAVSLCQKCDAVGGESDERIVCHVVGECAVLSFQVGDIDLRFAVPHPGEIEVTGVRCPAELVDSAFEPFGDVGALSCGEVIDAEAETVAFVSVTLHAEPGDEFSVR